MSAAVSSTGSSSLNLSSNKNAFLESINYEAVAAVVRQCDNQMSKTHSKPLSSLSANTNDSQKYESRGHHKQKLYAAELADLKVKSICNVCLKFGPGPPNTMKMVLLQPRFDLPISPPTVTVMANQLNKRP